MNKNDLDALKLLADWSKWLASTQAGVITLIGYATVSSKAASNNITNPAWIFVAICCFLVSLFAASFILFALPGIAQRLPPPEGQDVLMMGTLNGGGIRLVVFSVVQFLCFALGSMCLVIWTALQVLATP